MGSRVSVFFSLLLMLLFSCSMPSETSGTYMPEGLDRRDKTRYQQYLINGKTLYLTYCSNCHNSDGKGLAKLYPPLAKSDYLMEDIKRAACIIRNGQSGSIIVNGIKYEMAMPGQQKLSNIEIAQLLTYITNSWGNQKGFVTVQDTENYLNFCAIY